MNRSGMGVRGLCDNFTAPYVPEALQQFLAFCRTLDALKVEHCPSTAGGALLSLRSRRGAFTLLVPLQPGDVLRGSLYLSAPTARELEGDPLWDAFHRAVRLLLSTGTLWLYGEGEPRLSRFRNGRVVPAAKEEDEVGLTDVCVDAAELAHFLWSVRVDHLLDRLSAALKRGDAREADAVRQALRAAWQERYTKPWQERETKHKGLCGNGREACG